MGAQNACPFFRLSAAVFVLVLILILVLILVLVLVVHGTTSNILFTALPRW